MVDRHLLLAALSLPLAATPRLLHRMGGDLLSGGRLRRSTATWMWSAYAAYSGAMAAALSRKPDQPNRSTIRTVAGGLITGGVLLDLVAIRHFTGPRQLTGTAAGGLINGGIYRYSRHPQYVGILATLTGLTLARRSLSALALTVVLAGTYWAWSRVEEQHLLKCFGEPYREYLATTHRWLGPPRHHKDSPAS